MTKIYQPIDLSKLPAPELVEALDFEVIFSEMLTELQGLDPTFDALVESDPAYQILQVCAYREMGIRQRVNDAAKARMLAYASGSNLDHVGADRGVERLEGESDDAFRARIVLAPDSWSTAGPKGAYEFHALSAHADIKDVNVSAGGAGVVRVAVLSKIGNGACYGVRIRHLEGYAEGAVLMDVEALKMAIPSGAVIGFEGGASFEMSALAAVGDTQLHGELSGAVRYAERGGIIPVVEDALSADTIRPLNDVVLVVPAQIIEYVVSAELTLYDGPDADVVREASEAAINVYVAEQHRIGRDITISGMMAALHQPGVQEVSLISPAGRIEVDVDQAAYCTAVSVMVIGEDE